MNLLFVVGGYYPRFSATGNCVSKIALSLIKRHNIYVLSEKKDLSDSDSEKWRGHTIIRISTPRIRRRLLLVRDNKKYQLLFHKIKYFFSFLNSSGGLDYALVNAYLDRIRSICDEKHIDAILPCCMPIEGVFASLIYSESNPNVSFSPILFDLYSDSDIFFRFNFIKKLKHKKTFDIEKKILNQANYIFYVDNWKNYFLNHQYLNAIHIEHPLVEEPFPHDTISLKNRNLINIIYQGELNYEIRNPRHSISLLKKLLSRDENHDITLHFFSFGNANKEVENFSKNNKNCVLYGRVDKEVADSYFQDSNIVLIIGNSNPNIMPSKVFEAISSCKPILYIGCNEMDCVIDVLSKYPNKFVVTPTTINRNDIENLFQWITNCEKTTTSFSDISQLFKEYTPHYICDVINNCLEND